MELKIPLLHPNPHQLDCLTHNFHTITSLFLRHCECSEAIFSVAANECMGAVANLEGANRPKGTEASEAIF